MRHLFFLGIFLISTTSLFAQDRVFNYTYQSAVLGQGQREIEVWNTVRSGRENFYRALDTRIEFEFGVCNKLQTAFYLNSSVSAAELQSFDTVGNKSVSIESESEWSFSNEWKFKMSDPVANAIGSALYAEITVAPTELELEAKLILDKKVGKTMHALNLVVENEFETEVEVEDGKQEVEQESEFEFELDYGFSYNINPNWNVGVEVSNRNSKVDDKNISLLYAGPGFSYAKGPIWINLTVFPQITGFNNPDNSSGTYLNGHEKLETRLLFSYVF